MMPSDALASTTINRSRSLCAVSEARLLGGPSQLSLRIRHHLADCHETVRIQRDGIDTRFDQECRELGIVAGRLPAYSDLGAATMRTLDDVDDHALDGRIALIE